MAIRRPSVYRQNDFVVQDFLDYETEDEELRYLLVKYDGESFTLVKQTFDSNPPEFWGGSIIARIDYTLREKVVIIDHWEVFWRDEWPLRLGAQYLVNCLYKSELGYSILVNKEQYPFWVSENFFPFSNSPDDYLVENI